MNNDAVQVAVNRLLRRLKPHLLMSPRLDKSYGAKRNAYIILYYI